MKYSSSVADPIAVLRNLWKSPFPVRPQPSAIFAAIDALHLRIWLVMPYNSFFGNVYRKPVYGQGHQR